ncbi:hypothetical protein [Vibrio splendidus]|uniref:hypothetical protein n=1 Tax=Vibrio splendidus TaxID=29497 RepID=UPI000769DE51|nr:hypothetical protein [Vibrio splendidus]PHX05724.1 Glycosyltransferase Gtf1 [Vibrio splendidus]
MSKPKILFIQDDAEVLGGTKTLISRLAKQLIEQDFEVSILFKSSDANTSVLSIFPKGCKLKFISVEAQRKVLYPYNIKEHIPKLDSEYHAIISLSFDGYYFSKVLGQFYNIKGPKYWYVVNPEVYIDDPLTTKAKRMLMKGDNENNFIFMNKECSYQFSDVFEHKIVPLPVSMRKETNPNNHSYTIVSIGRICSLMKTYNWSLIPVIIKLKEKFPNLVWYIYGDGGSEDVEDLKKTIMSNDCGGFIKYMGKVEYNDMERVLDGKSMFIGMGTSAVEAASTGIPTIVPIAFEKKPVSYGFLHELPAGNVGEKSLGLKVQNISSLINKVFEFNENEFILLSEKTKKSALQFKDDVVFNKFLLAISDGSADKPSSQIDKFEHYLLFLMARVFRVTKRLVIRKIRD